MQFIIPLWGGLMGLVVGSFLNVVIRRGVRGESLRGRSHCESCGKTLSPRELVPVISYILQKGRCTTCGAPASLQYPIVELATGIIFFLLTRHLFQFPTTAWTIGYWLFATVAASAVIVAFTSDWQYKIIPNGSVLALLIVGVASVVSRAIQSNGTVVSFVLYDIGFALLFALFFAALWFLSDGAWMGLGDAKLFFPLALILGFPASLAAFLLSFWLGGIWGGVLLLLRRSGLKDTIPFGPFIIAGAAIAFFYIDYLKAFERYL